MQKRTARWIALLSATLLFLTFALTACAEKKEEGLGELRALYIVTKDLQTNYKVGDEFDYSSVKLRAVYDNGDEPLTAADKDKGVTHTDLDMTKAGTQTLTVSYKGKDASIGITITEEQKAVLKGLQFSGGKTSYTVGDAIDYHAFTLSAIYTVGDDKTLYGDSAGVTHNNIDMSKDGTQKLTFTYQEDGVSKNVSVDIIIAKKDVPAPVVLISIEVRSTAAIRTYEYGANVDYSKFTIVRHYSDGSTKDDLNGTSAGVTHTTIDTHTAGEQELTFTYKEDDKTLTAIVPITVLAQKEVVTLQRFAPPAFYTKAAAVESDEAGTASEDRDSFMNGFETYKVGDDNAFEFQPDATILVSATQVAAVTVRTTFTLELKGEGNSFTAVDSVDTYVTTNPLLPNYYDFTEKAVGKVFKLTVKPDDGYKVTGEEDAKIEAIIEVVDGYNVYDQIGLSVFDNLNVKHWQAIKKDAGTLRWDDRPLTEYNVIKKDDPKNAPVSNIVLHSDITIDPDQLPDSYFWKTSDGEAYNTVNTILKSNAEIPDAVKNHLEGSLKDGFNKDSYYKFDDTSSGELQEDVVSSVNMQKGVYVSTGTGIQGNFHRISYLTSGLKHSLYTVYDGKTEKGSASPLSHWSLFKYGNETTEGVTIVNDGTPVVSDLRILGQSPRLAATGGEPAHLMAFNSCTNTMTLDNCIVSRLFVVVMGDEVSSGVNVSNSKIFDIYSNMFYLWRASVNVKKSIMEDAGGPVFILCDGGRKAGEEDGHGTLTFDAESRLVSEAAGEESWYKLNDATAIFTQLKGQVLNYIHTGTQREPMHKDGEVELFNVIAIIIPEPSSLQGNSELTIFPRGEIKRGEEGAYTDEYAVDWKFPAGGILQMAGQTPDTIYNSMAPIFISGTEKVAYLGVSLAQYLYVSTENITSASAGTVNFVERGTDWLFATMRAGEHDPRFGILFGDVTEYSAS